MNYTDEQMDKRLDDDALILRAVGLIGVIISLIAFGSTYL